MKLKNNEAHFVLTKDSVYCSTYGNTHKCKFCHKEFKTVLIPKSLYFNHNCIMSCNAVVKIKDFVFCRKECAEEWDEVINDG